MTLELDGRQLRFTLAAPPGGAAVRLSSEGRTFFEGALADLTIEIDTAEWQVPLPLVDLLQISLPPVGTWSPEKFAPLQTPWISLATARLGPTLESGTWTEPAAISNSFLPLSVVAGVIHYSQSVFEGSKVFFRDRGDHVEARFFRQARNARRMWRSALRMAMPLDRTTRVGEPMTEAGFRRLYEDMVGLAVMANREALFAGAFQPIDPADPELVWHQAPRALYVRPVLFASGPVLGVRPSDHYTFATYVTPAGRYRADLVLRLERHRKRAWPGGTGAVKASANYAPTLKMMQELLDNKLHRTPSTPWEAIYDDLLFVDRHDCIEEMGGANFFAIRREGPQVILHTPPSIDDDENADTILPGVTRETILWVAQRLGVAIRIAPLPAAALLDLSEAEARATAVFTTGTAAGVAPVVGVIDGERFQRFAVWDDVEDPARNRSLRADVAAEGSPLAVGRLIRGTLFRVQLDDQDGLRALVPGLADRILAEAAAERFVDTLVLPR